MPRATSYQDPTQIIVSDLHCGSIRHILTRLGKVAISCSTHIFNARNGNHLMPPPSE